MATLNIDLSGRGGLVPRFWGDPDKVTAIPSRRILGSDGQMAGGIYNPFRNYGYLSPANATIQSVTASSSSFSSVMGSSLYDVENDDFYFAERGSKLWKGDTLDDTTVDLVLDLGSTGSPDIFDLETYQVNGVRKMFVLYEVSDKLEMSISAFPYNDATDDPTWLSATVVGTAGSYPIVGDAFMQVADNGYAYVFMDNQVHKIDGTTLGGTNGTITNNVLLFPPYFRCVDAVDYRGLMFIAIHQYSTELRGSLSAINARTMNTGVYIWDRLSKEIQTRDYISVQGCKEIRKLYIAPNGKLRLFALNSENISVIMEYNGSTFEPIVETGILGCPRFRDSVVTVGQTVMWLSAVDDAGSTSGVIFAHGQISPFDKEALYKIGKIDSFGTQGALIFGGANADSTTAGFKKHKTGLYLAYSNATPTSVITEWDIYGTGADGVTALGLASSISTLRYALPPLSTVKSIDIYMLSLGTNSTTAIANIGIYVDSRVTPFANKTITYADALHGVKHIEINQPYVNSIQLIITPDGSIPTGGEEFLPYLAIVTYEPTSTR